LQNSRFRIQGTGSNNKAVAYRESWGEAVRQAINASGRSVRSMAPEVGCSSSYIGQWQLGQVPDEALVRSFARVTGLDETGLLRAAGYLPPFDPDLAFMAGARQIAAECGEIRADSRELELAEATPEEVARVLDAIRKRVCCREKAHPRR
jgi:transcriptional regulator with XRE-family HTH domain